LKKRFIGPLLRLIGKNKKLSAAIRFVQERFVSEGAFMGIVVDHGGQRCLVLVETWDGWHTLPGGAKRSNESLKVAAIRETEEEVNVKVTECRFIGVWTERGIPRHLFLAVLWEGDVAKDGVEIKEAVLVPLERIPDLLGDETMNLSPDIHPLLRALMAKVEASPI